MERIRKFICFVFGHKDRVSARKEYPGPCKPGEVLMFQGAKPEEIIMLTHSSYLSVPTHHQCERCGRVRNDARFAWSAPI